MSFLCGASGKESACQCRKCRRLGFDPWVGKILGGINGHPLWYSCWENPMNRGPWWASVHGNMLIRYQHYWLPGWGSVCQISPLQIPFSPCSHPYLYILGSHYCVQPTLKERWHILLNSSAWGICFILHVLLIQSLLVSL